MFIVPIVLNAVTALPAIPARRSASGAQGDFSSHSPIRSPAVRPGEPKVVCELTPATWPATLRMISRIARPIGIGPGRDAAGAAIAIGDVERVAHRAVDDEAGIDRCGRRIDAVQFEIGLADRRDRRDDQLERGGGRARHHRVDHDLLDGAFRAVGHPRDQLVGIAIVRRQERADARVGRRDQRQPVAPALLERECRERLDIVLRIEPPAGQPVDLAARRAAIAADEQLGSRDAAMRRRDPMDRHAACSRAVRLAPMTPSRPSK